MKRDQDYYALCTIDPKLAALVKQMALEERKTIRQLLDASVRQRRVRVTKTLARYWAALSPVNEKPWNSKRARARS
jgi:hypothetical protein